MDAVTIFLAFLGATFLRLLTTEIHDWLPSLAHWIIERAAARLPKHQRARYREEWYAHLDECPGRLGKVCHAFGCLLSSIRLTPTPAQPREEHETRCFFGRIYLSDELSPLQQELFMEMELEHIRAKYQTDINNIEVILVPHSFLQQDHWASFIEIRDQDRLLGK